MDHMFKACDTFETRIADMQKRIKFISEKLSNITDNLEVMLKDVSVIVNELNYLKTQKSDFKNQIKIIENMLKTDQIINDLSESTIDKIAGSLIIEQKKVYGKIIVSNLIGKAFEIDLVEMNFRDFLIEIMKKFVGDVYVNIIDVKLIVNGNNHTIMNTVSTLDFAVKATQAFQKKIHIIY